MNYYLQAFKLVVGLLTLTLALRALGKHSLSQMTPYDVVYLIVFGGILDSTFFDDEIGMMPFLFSVIIWSLSIYLIETLVRENSTLRLLFRGTPDLIIENGKFNMKLVKKNNLEMEQLRTILRIKGIFSLREVKDMYIETDGSFSIIKYADYQQVVNASLDLNIEENYTNVLLIDNGEIEYRALDYIGKSESWLDEQLKEIGVQHISDLLYCEWTKESGFYYKSKSDTVDKNHKGYPN